MGHISFSFPLPFRLPACTQTHKRYLWYVSYLLSVLLPLVAFFALPRRRYTSAGPARSMDALTCAYPKRAPQHRGVVWRYRHSESKRRLQYEGIKSLHPRRRRRRRWHLSVAVVGVCFCCCHTGRASGIAPKFRGRDGIPIQRFLQDPFWVCERLS